ncbi:adenosylcobinamide-phosphate synthase CbiB [Pseudobutyrivibrio sp.]|uniref:adenosylcobinamide-phosphate synthase CbiB n=1 Tax=Pseudobutyrivibrio sp. TaxID=2014367 RepID=UPI001DBC3629|nr:adenosylcobinamide-phosphate synthase CbiB [Pseudobutyrivibrio sp.]MBE5911304.1 cobalamin biosynthesis protein CobD [Pseudobutyrivibrio sp.]
MIYHLMAFVAGFVLDLFLGDPINWPHPIRWIGSLIGFTTRELLDRADRSLDTDSIHKRKRLYGLFLVIIVITISGGISFLLLFSAYTINTLLGVIIEAIMTYYCLASKSLYSESMKVFHALKNEGLDSGRRAVSMIVGRDTVNLDQNGVIKAAVETVAENTSDGVIAPMIYLAIGGPVLGFIYKAINTMDSMVGYKNDKYMDFGRIAAKLDDIANFIPARISALLMIISCLFLGSHYSFFSAIRIYARDRYNHSSPNSAHTESVCAGALGLRLAGPASYFGKTINKPFIGDNIRTIQLDDIKRANVLMFATAFLCQIICILILLLAI